MTGPQPKQPSPDLAVVHGPAIAVDSGLLRWVADQRDGERAAVVQLPVVVDAARDRTARLATANGAATIAVQLDDAALGVALADRLLERAAGEPRAAWLEGTWIATTEPPTLRVTRWLRPLTNDQCGTTLFARRAVGTDADRGLVAALDELGSDAPAATKEAASRTLVAAGTAAIPLLIASLGDGRTFAVRDLVNRMNLPATASPAPMLAARTVGTHCEDLLYRIVTPPPTVAIDHRGKVLSEQVLAIADWSAFWSKRRSWTLAAIHAELAPLVDEYWRRGGTTQRVD
ncbi:MAG: hypothetical protein U1E73_10500 [Planctomycetota bacterium]